MYMFLDTASLSLIPCSGFASAKFYNFLGQKITRNWCGICDLFICGPLGYKRSIITISVFINRKKKMF